MENYRKEVMLTHCVIVHPEKNHSGSMRLPNKVKELGGLVGRFVCYTPNSSKILTIQQG